MKKPKFKLAFAVSVNGEIDLNRIEPFTDEGRSDLIRGLNRPAGESVIKVRVSPAAVSRS
jgi:hypothetical protein